MKRKKKFIIISTIILIAIFTLPIRPKKIHECKNEHYNCGCPDVITPVCGIDNITYENHCDACCNGKDYTKGECGKIKRISIKSGKIKRISAIELLVKEHY